jgi:hypothetical protein
LLVRYLREEQGFQWGVLAGALHNEILSGISLQGELMTGLGVQAEAHASTDGGNQYFAAVLGLEYRLASGLELRCEQYRDSRGFSSTAALERVSISTASLPLHWGRDYSALGANYQFTPLLTGDLLLLTNWSDRSGLVAVNAVYSLTDNSEMTFGLAVPWGRKPEKNRFGSEFGLYPTTLNLDFRHFF